MRFVLFCHSRPLFLTKLLDFPIPEQLQPVLHEDDTNSLTPDHRSLFTDHHSLPSGCAFLSLKGNFSPQKCPFKAILEAKYKRCSCNVNKMIWSDSYFANLIDKQISALIKP